jgi:hypothetical protein
MRAAHLGAAGHVVAAYRAPDHAGIQFGGDLCDAPACPLYPQTSAGEGTNLQSVPPPRDSGKLAHPRSPVHRHHPISAAFKPETGPRGGRIRGNASTLPAEDVTAWGCDWAALALQIVGGLGRWLPTPTHHTTPMSKQLEFFSSPFTHPSTRPRPRTAQDISLCVMGGPGAGSKQIQHCSAGAGVRSMLKTEGRRLNGSSDSDTTVGARPRIAPRSGGVR